ncbi:MAG TPA: hypothetical protein VE992_07980 [Solirubrobacteraceae bacterium]|nr:hypothetical protein [Solirubrobacteraceae bacterium]
MATPHLSWRASEHRAPATGRAAARSEDWPHRHEEAVVQAEARRLALTLAPYRVLPKDALARVAGASHWHEGSFDRALAAAIRSGMIDRLPGGFLRDGGPPRTAQH